MSTFGLIDPEFGPRGLIDPEFTNTGLIDAELSSSTTTATLASEDDSWGPQLACVTRVAASVILALAVTTFGHADELPSSAPSPALDDGFCVDLRVAPPRPLTQIWTIEDDLPTRVDEDYQHPLVSLRVLPQTPSWIDGDFVPLPTTTVVDEDYYAAYTPSKSAPTLALPWVDSDEIPVLVPTDVDFTPLLDQKINRPVDTTLWTQQDEWPTPLPPSCVPTESEWTPLLFDKLEKSRDLRIWDYADELPNANVPEETDWTPDWRRPVIASTWLAAEQDDLPSTSIPPALEETDWLPSYRRPASAPSWIADAQDDLPNANVPDESFSTPFLGQKLEPPKFSYTWEHVDELPNPTPQEESDYTPLLGQRIDRPSFAKVFDVPDEHPIITVVVPTETEYTPLVDRRIDRVSHARVWNVDDDQPVLAVIAHQYTIIKGNASYAPIVTARASVTTQTINARASFVNVINGSASMLGISNPIPPN